MDSPVLQAILTSMQQGVAFVDNKDRIAYCNPAVSRVLNIPPDKILNQPILDFHPQKSRPKIQRVIEDLRSGNVKGPQQMNIQMVEGKFYDMTYSGVWNSKGEYLGVIVVVRDVTERKMAEHELKQALKRLKLANEELKRLDQMKDDFLSNVSHELKTPMISLMGYVGMILKEKVGPLTEEQKRFLEICYRNLRKLGKSIDDLLDLSEMGIRKKDWTFEPVDLSKVIQFSSSTVEPLAREYQIEVKTQLLADSMKIPGVEEKLNQLFDNLLTNAIKYNRQGGKILIRLEQDPEFAFVQIADTGVGIGLSLVQEIVDLHKGRIHIESEVGKGTTFTVMLPKIS
jgi:PAS domain S-box-containing protein